MRYVRTAKRTRFNDQDAGFAERMTGSARNSNEDLVSRGTWAWGKQEYRAEGGV